MIACTSHLFGLYFLEKNMIRNLRNSIAIKMFGDKKFLKAIAFVLLYHEVTNSNICKDYSVSKLSNLTGVHASTIKNRLQTLKNRNLAKIEKGTLVFTSITSKHRERNKKLDNFSFKNLIEIEKSLFALLVCILQERKDFIHRAFLDAKYSVDYKTIKRAKARIRKYAKGKKFSEKGISYKKIAKRLGISVKSAFEYVKFAVEKGFLSKFTHFKTVFYRNINYYPMEGYTFTTRNYAYRVGANTYVVSGASLPYYKYINKEDKKIFAHRFAK